MEKDKSGKAVEMKSELRVPTSSDELTYLVKTGKIDRPSSWDAITRLGDVCL